MEGQHGPAVIAMQQQLVAAVQDLYQPENVLATGLQLETNGTATVSMSKYECDACNERHTNDDSYTVFVDLKRRVMHGVCAITKANGPVVPFPAHLASLSLADVGELQPGTSVFPAGSTTARTVLAFAQAIFIADRKVRTVPATPDPGTAPLMYHRDKTYYEVTFPNTSCQVEGCGGEKIFLRVTRDKLCIRCTGKKCKTKGKRWERPSHSAAYSGEWNLSFLFPYIPPRYLPLPPPQMAEAATAQQQVPIQPIDHAALIQSISRHMFDPIALELFYDYQQSETYQTQYAAAAAKKRARIE
jgi:hypothetical protein